MFYRININKFSGNNNQKKRIMFRKNTKHLQPDLFGLLNTLPERMKKKVKESEEYYFYELIFSQIDEEIFSVLYSDKKSRPNAPINALVGALTCLTVGRF